MGDREGGENRGGRFDVAAMEERYASNWFAGGDGGGDGGGNGSNDKEKEREPSVHIKFASSLPKKDEGSRPPQTAGQSLAWRIRSFVSAGSHPETEREKLERQARELEEEQRNRLSRERSLRRKNRAKHRAHWGAANIIDNAALFVSTWNMCGAFLPTTEELMDWVPLEYDIYAISLQECKYMKEMRASVLKRLNQGSATGEKYNAFVHFIGPKKNLLVLMLFVRKSLVSSGAFRLECINGVSKQEVHRGTKYFFGSQQRTSDRGAVSMFFKFHHTVIAFIACRLAGGSGKLESLTTDVRKIFQRMGIKSRPRSDLIGIPDLDKVHHVFFMGDMNTKVRYPPGKTLKDLVGRPEHQAHEWDLKRWLPVLKYDEMVKLRKKVPVLRMFEEVPVNFPPTSLRRQRPTPFVFLTDHLEGEGAGEDSTGPRILPRGYTKSMELVFTPQYDVEMLFEPKSVASGGGSSGGSSGIYKKEKRRKIHPPSYTDRILWRTIPQYKKLLESHVTGTVETIRSSSHVPVYASFRLAGIDDLLLTPWQKVSGNVPPRYSTRSNFIKTNSERVMVSAQSRSYNVYKDSKFKLPKKEAFTRPKGFSSSGNPPSSRSPMSSSSPTGKGTFDVTGVEAPTPTKAEILRGQSFAYPGHAFAFLDAERRDSEDAFSKVMSGELDKPFSEKNLGSSRAAMSSTMDSATSFCLNGWNEYFDERFQRLYYYNDIEKRSSWSAPPGFLKAKKNHLSESQSRSRVNSGDFDSAFGSLTYGSTYASHTETEMSETATETETDATYDADGSGSAAFGGSFSSFTASTAVLTRDKGAKKLVRHVSSSTKSKGSSEVHVDVNAEEEEAAAPDDPGTPSANKIVKYVVESESDDEEDGVLKASSRASTIGTVPQNPRISLSSDTDEMTSRSQASSARFEEAQQRLVDDDDEDLSGGAANVSTTLDKIQETQHQLEALGTCAACSKPLYPDQESLEALGGTYHMECFVCADSGVQLGTTFYEHEGKAYCRESFTNLFCRRCEACKGIMDKEYVKGPQDKYYHRSCFCCEECQEPFITDMNDEAAPSEFIERDGSCFCEGCFYDRYGEKCGECGKTLGKGDTIYKVKKPDGSELVLCKEHYEEQYAHKCAKCGKEITGEMFRQNTSSGSKLFHAGCFCCFKCQKPISECGGAYVEHEGQVYCYEHFSIVTGRVCGVCDKTISVDEKMIEYRGSKLHLACFCCAECGKNLVGEKYMERDGKVYCSDHFNSLFGKKCKRCGEFAAGEYYSISRSVWHKHCFTCQTCGVSLEGKPCIPLDGEISCRECAKKVRK